MVNAYFCHVYGANKRIFAGCQILQFCKVMIGGGTPDDHRPPTDCHLIGFSENQTYSVAYKKFSVFTSYSVVLLLNFCFFLSYSVVTLSDFFIFKSHSVVVVMVKKKTLGE